RTALHIATGRGDARSIRVLLAHHANVGTLDPAGDPPLAIAAAIGRAECVDALLAGGADPNQPNGRNGLRPLDAAVLFGAPETLERLLRAGADPNAPNARGETALHHAATLDSARSLLVADVLLGHGANPAARDVRGFTPLHVAASRDNVAVVRFYLDRKLELNTPSAWGQTPFDVAMAYGADFAADALFEGGARSLMMSPSPPLFEASRTNDVSRLLRLLAAGVDREESLAGKTARDIARESGSEDALRLLGPSRSASDAKH
ncbi:MAG TPA: ankyrin repeat domain-containing protein, partial [Caldimonas sp.]|nr:ankyrin repeat domain-containing protein [Caldimonas sp.]